MVAMTMSVAEADAKSGVGKPCFVAPLTGLSQRQSTSIEGEKIPQDRSTQLELYRAEKVS